MPGPTNKQLAEDITEVKSDVKDMRKEVTQLAQNVAIVLDRQNRKSDGTIDWQKILERALVAISVSLSIVYMVVEFLIKGAK